MVLADVLSLRGLGADIVAREHSSTDAIGVSESCGAYGVADMGRRLLDSSTPTLSASSGVSRRVHGRGTRSVSPGQGAIGAKPTRPRCVLSAAAYQPELAAVDPDPSQ